MGTLLTTHGTHRFPECSRVLRVLISLLVICGFPARIPAAVQTTTEAARLAFDKAGYQTATIGIAILDAKSSELLFEQNARKSLLPASCMKVITTICAMHYLGPDARFQTRLYARGSTLAGSLDADLVVLGGGDPTFGSNRVDGSATSATILQSWLKAIKAAGIHTVKGSVISDSSYFPPDPIPGTWEWEDIGNYYGAGPNGLNFRDNFFDLILRPGIAIGDPARFVGVEPQLPHDIHWEIDVLTSGAKSGDQADVYSSPGSRFYRVAGTIPVGGEMHVKATLHDPGLTFAKLLMDYLTSSGIAVAGEPRNVAVRTRESATSTCLATVQSPPIRDIVRVLNKQSFNLYAEVLLMQIGAAAGGWSRNEAIERELGYLRLLQLPLDGFHIKDGSGLSRGDNITALAVATLCQRVQREPWFADWLNSLPVLGVDGDLRDRGKGTLLSGKVRAKSGLINRVRGLCGFLEANSGRKLIFAIHLNGYENTWNEVDQDIDHFLSNVAEQF